jgi:dTMP kinase
LFYSGSNVYFNNFFGIFFVVFFVVGTFIVFDGGPGCGKGTMIKKTFEFVFGKSKKYDNILVTDEPTNGPYGKRVRELFKQQKSPSALRDEILSAFISDRKWHIENIIKPALEKNFVVLADRYKYGTVAYQSVQGSSFQEVLDLNIPLLAPDLALILDVDPKEAVRRMCTAEDVEKRKTTDNFRQEEFISNLRSYFTKMPQYFPKENVHIIDATVSKDEVFAQIAPLLEKVLF